MDTKFVIFVAISISALLVAAIYSSSIPVVFGAALTKCVRLSKTTSWCEVVQDDLSSSQWSCTKHKDGTWSCVQAAETGGSSNIPAGLTDALVKAQAGITTGGSNNTNVLKGGGPVEGGANTEGNNISTNSNATLQ